MENKTLHIATRKVRRTMRTFRFVYMNKTITVLETLHPKARADQFFQWNDISLEYEVKNMREYKRLPD